MDSGALVAVVLAASPALASGAPGGGSDAGSVLLALAAILVAARSLAALGKRYLGQPPVIGEIIAGLLLGPSCLGALAPSVAEFLIPPPAIGHLSVISSIGVVLFLFVVGVELDPQLLRSSTRRVIGVSAAGIVVPFAGGLLLAPMLYAEHGTGAESFAPFAMFLGVSLSVTAFPVLARILTDRGVQSTPVGAMALACASVDDVAAWSLLAVAVGIAKADVSSPLVTITFIALYVSAMLWVVRPLYAKLAAREEILGKGLSRASLAWILAGLLVSAWSTDRLGIHPLFGAFLFGAILPHEGRLATELRTRVEDMVVVLFLPAFFVVTGLRTQLSLVTGGADLAMTALIVAVASIGKFGGSFCAARLTGMVPRDAALIGVLMNTRGLMELIVLNVGLDLGLISPRLFAMLVIMALVTTFATSPLFDLIAHGAPQGAGGASPARRDS